MTEEFKQFLKNEKIPVKMFTMLPKVMQEDIENKYYELKGEKENEC